MARFALSTKAREEYDKGEPTRAKYPRTRVPTYAYIETLVFCHLSMEDYVNAL